MPPRQIKPKAPPRRRVVAGAAAETTESTEATASQNTDDAPPPAAEAASTAAPAAPVASVLPTPTAAAANSEPILPPTGRLDSVRGRGTATRGPALKFKPKAVQRKSKEEREAMEREAQSTAAATVEVSVDTGGRGRGRGRGDRGRGDRGGRGRGRGGAAAAPRIDEPATASGPFALGSVTSGKQKATIERGRATDGERPVRHGLRRSKPKDELDVEKDDYEGYSSSDSQGPKLEVGKFEEEFIIDDDDWMEEGGPTMMPFRVERTEHVERAVEVVGDVKREGGKKSELDDDFQLEFLNSLRVKRGQEEAMDVDGEEGGKIKIKTEPGTVVDDPELLPDADAVQSPEIEKKKQRRRSSVASTKPKLRFEEDEEELYIMQERFKLLRDFGMLKVGEDVKPVIRDDGTLDISHQIREFPANLNEKLFHVQLPPYLPELAPLSSSLPPPPDPTLPPKKAPVYSVTNPPPIPEGQVGYLRIHASGRMSIQWGTGPDSLILDVNRGVIPKFPVEVMSVDVDAGDGEDENGNKVGTAYTLGELKGKIVAGWGWDAIKATMEEDRA